MDIIKIKKDKIPYRTKIKFSNGIFEFRFRYNRFADRIYVDVYNEDSELLADSEKLVYGIPLWYKILEDNDGNLNIDFPDKYIIPLSADGEERPVNLKNLQENIFLTIQDRYNPEGTINVTLYNENIRE